MLGSALPGRAWLFLRGLLAGALFGFVLGLVCKAAASSESAPVTNDSDYILENWQVEQGLPHISVSSIAQTPDGYLWAGTFSGLARFDGVRFKVFRAGNTPALGDNAITGLEVDQQGALWIVTLAGGLVRMAGGKFTAVQREWAHLLLGAEGTPKRPGRRLLLLDLKGAWHRIEQGQLLPLDQAEAVESDPDPGFMFLNTSASWIAQPGKIVHSYLRPVSVLVGEGTKLDRIDLTFHSAAASKGGGYWVATSNGVYRLRQGQLSARVAPLPTVIDKQLLMQEDGQGSLWTGKWAGGVFRLDSRGAWQQFGVREGLADNHVNCFFRDREGSLWIGTGQGGLHRVRPNVFHTYSTESGPNVVMSVTQDRQDRMWLGVNGGGLHTWTNGKLKQVTEPARLRAYPLAYSVLADRQNALWIGLYGLKALRWNVDDVVVYNLDDGSGRAMTPNALFEDRRGTVWLGCAHSLLRYEGDTFTRYTLREGLSSETVVALTEDRAGTLYIGTAGGGLNCRQQGRFASFTERDGLADSHITSLYTDDEDTLWIGTVDGGLCRFRNGQFRTAGVQAGLPTETIGQMVEDGLGNLWLGSNRGIIRVNRLALNQYLDGKRSSVLWHVFGLSDGLSTVSCVGASQPACCKAQDGKLWFSTTKGVAVVDPAHIPFNQLPPPVAIEEVVLDDRAQQNDAASLTVPPRTHRVEFHFTGLSLMAPEKVQFRYRLEPFDRDWIQAGTRRIAYYSGIRPGKYQFHVTACNNDGVWNETGASLAVAVLPPWWMTWWFRGLTALSLAGLVFGWYEWRLRSLRREQFAQESFSRRLIASQENERQRIAGELHDGLGQDLLVIASQAQFGLAQEELPAGAAARLRDIADTAKRAVHQVRRMAHNLRPGLIEELGFTKAVRATVEKAAQASGVSTAVSLTEVDGLLPPEFEVNLFRIAQETLNNVLKHAGASEVKVTLTKDSGWLRLTVEDNGCGFDPGRIGSRPPNQAGFGLRQISQRAKMMGGRLSIQSQPGRGTLLTVEVPLLRRKLNNPG